MVRGRSPIESRSAVGSDHHIIITVPIDVPCPGHGVAHTLEVRISLDLPGGAGGNSSRRSRVEVGPPHRLHIEGKIVIGLACQHVVKSIAVYVTRRRHGCAKMRQIAISDHIQRRHSVGTRGGSKKDLEDSRLGASDAIDTAHHHIRKTVAVQVACRGDR